MNLNNFTIPDKYKGFKIYVSHYSKTFRVYEKMKVIEYSPDFIKNLNGPQKFFILTWCIKYYKLRNHQRASNAALDIFKLNGGKEQDVLNLIRRINENKKFLKFVHYNLLDHLKKTFFKNILIESFYSVINKFKSIIKIFIP